MPPGSSRIPLLPGFSDGAGDKPGPQDVVTSHTGEYRHALQDDRSGAAPGSVSGIARTAAGEQVAAAGDERLRAQPETPPRIVDGPPQHQEAGGRAAPDRLPGAGTGDP